MKYDFTNDTMTIDGVDYQLKPYRWWLLDNHELLVSKHHVKTLQVGGKAKRYYDWQAIYFLSSEYGFLNDYLKTL